MKKQDHIRLIHDDQITIQLASGTSNSKQSIQTAAVQRRFEVLNIRYKNREIKFKQLLATLSLFNKGQKNNINMYL